MFKILGLDIVESSFNLVSLFILKRRLVGNKETSKF